MALIEMGTLADLFDGMQKTVTEERERIIAWLRAHDGQDARAIAAGACIDGSTMHGELRDQASYYGEVADALERGADSAWSFGFARDGWLSPPLAQSERTGA